MDIDNEALQALMGREKVRHYVVTARDIKRFAQAIGSEDPLHFDEEYARASRYGAITAPPLFCQMFTFEDVPIGLLPADGSPLELDVPIPATRAVGGGSHYEVMARVKAGDVITVKTRLQDVSRREGRSGLLYFVVVETRFYNQDDALVAREVATYIKR